MKVAQPLKAMLIIAGLIIAGIGGIILLWPVDYFATNGVDITGSTSLLNEIRAPAGALLAAGILILAGAFIPQLTYTSTLISTLFYLAYGFARMLSMAVDGQPTTSLVIVAVLEIGIGLVCLFAFLKYGAAYMSVMERKTV
ncbi:MAG: DUF4345 domain-containing protein [Caldilineaceae bacterium]